MQKIKRTIRRVSYDNIGGVIVPTGFVLEGEGCSDVDPFVCGEFVGEPEFNSLIEMKEWFESQVGKTLFCDDLVTKYIATIGKTYIA